MLRDVMFGTRRYFRELLAGAEEGIAGPDLWADFMDELRESHLGIPRPDPDRPTATDRLAQAYAAALAEAYPR
ncbi:hypothetical protein [Nocardia brasiliensis]|uniref:hypothetical protein n=1 Tax=Nocardia brasiliensis TaxID=37326 RepID=UPI000AA759D2|nr:hypothetical protein [Nocardia brasiliensis]